MAGVPFEHIDALATTDTAVAARELLVRQREFEATRAEVERILASRRHNLSRELFRAWRNAVRTGVMPPISGAPSQAFATCWTSAAHVAEAEARFDGALERELLAARAALLESSRTILPRYLIFGATAVQELVNALAKTAATAVPPTRKKSVRARERHLLLYVQRVCAKNDTLSEFGPGSWGTSDRAIAGLSLALNAVSQRETFLERWTAHGAAAALNDDDEVRVELSPRLHPNGRVVGHHFEFTDTSEFVPIDPATLEILSRCDGKTPAYSLGMDLAALEQLAERKMIRWEVEVPALAPHAFDTLVADVAAWREGATRSRWLERLQPIADLPRRFAATTDTTSRISIIDEAQERLEQLGTARRISDRSLYSATNPIGEECFRECNFRIGGELIDEVAIDAAPWIDLWRDSFAFVASRVAEGLSGLLSTAPLQNGAIPLPAFRRHCEQSKMPLTGPALVALAHIGFQEVKAAFRKMMAPHVGEAEYELTADDCHFVRRNFDYPKFDEFTYPSGDFQLSAKSVEAVSRGEYQWILAELHPPVALLHHGFYWSCPEKPALHRALASTTNGQPSFHFGFFAADFTATTAVRQLDAMPESTSFVAPERSSPNWKTIHPADVEVHRDGATGDVRLRQRDTHEDLGSFARAWVIPLGFHPFYFGHAPHMPRLRCGKVVVQRRSWTVALEELGPGDFTGVSRNLVVAIETLRAARDLPRYIYIRPTEQALRRSGAEGRDKDTKPVFIDLESYLFLEIFHRWLAKAGELDVTEMLPDPDHLLWQEADGRRTFELRTQIVPR